LRFAGRVRASDVTTVKARRRRRSAAGASPVPWQRPNLAQIGKRQPDAHDAQGRVTSKQTRCSGSDDAGPASKLASEEKYTYEPDGSVRFESLDYENDTPNDVISDGDGGLRSVTRSITTSSAACAAIEAAIGRPADQRCRQPMLPMRTGKGPRDRSASWFAEHARRPTRVPPVRRWAFESANRRFTGAFGPDTARP
jgi:hypothetical protein